jgi:hypothetical protein
LIGVYNAGNCGEANQSTTLNQKKKKKVLPYIKRVLFLPISPFNHSSKQNINMQEEGKYADKVLVDGYKVDDVNSIDQDNVQQSAHKANVEKRLVRILDYRLMIWAFWGYFANGLDRNNMPNAQTTGLSEDLGLVGNEYNWAITMFFIGYIVYV